MEQTPSCKNHHWRGYAGFESLDFEPFSRKCKHPAMKTGMDMKAEKEAAKLAHAEWKEMAKESRMKSTRTMLRVGLW